MNASRRQRGTATAARSVTDARGVRAVAGALSAAPIGFGAGAFLSGRCLIADVAADPQSASIVILGFALLGAGVAAGALALLSVVAPPRPARIATLIAGGLSFALLVFMASDYVMDRIDRARAFDVAYARVPAFEVTLESSDLHRRPFSTLTFVVDPRTGNRNYEALRPSGWFCRGQGHERHALEMFEALSTVEVTGPTEGCGRRASWTVEGEAGVTGLCADDGEAFAMLFATADDMIEATERRSSCRRAPPPGRGLSSPESANG